MTPIQAIELLNNLAQSCGGKVPTPYQLQPIAVEVSKFRDDAITQGIESFMNSQFFPRKKELLKTIREHHFRRIGEVDVSVEDQYPRLHQEFLKQHTAEEFNQKVAETSATKIPHIEGFLNPIERAFLYTWATEKGIISI